MGRVILKIQHFMFVVFILIGTFFSESVAESKLSDGVIDYSVIKEKERIYGTLNCMGSTNVGALLNVWLPEFQEFYPKVKSTVDFKGSGQGITGLMNGTANIGAMSRPIKPKEFDKFKKLKGYSPTEVKVSLDALVVYVNRLNPLNKMTFEELDAVFSTSPKQGYNNSVKNWKEFSGKDGKVNIYLYNKESGTRSYFRSKVMLKGEFNSKNIVSDEYTKLNEVIDKVAEDSNGICFGSLGSTNYRVKMLSLAKKKYFPSFRPDEKYITNGEYPLTRFFYIYLDIPPHKTIPPLIYEFCKFILSRNGQKVVLQSGGLPLSPKQIGLELLKIRR